MSSSELFQKLKISCVPLLGSSLLTPSSTPKTLSLLSQLIATLREADSQGTVLSPSLISYTFFPLSTILQRNAAPDIPDQVLEALFAALAILCESWWWNCDIAIWEQIFMLSGSIIGGIDAKGKGKARSDETKRAAAQCLYVLVRERCTPEELSRFSSSQAQAAARMAQIRAQVQTPKFIPVYGQTLNALLETAESPDFSLQSTSLDLLNVLVAQYAPDDFVPSILPGVVSIMTRIALGRKGGKGWVHGEIVAKALQVMDVTITRAISDDACIASGTIHPVTDLEDLENLTTARPQSTPKPTAPYSTLRTEAWLQGTSSQLHIAINTLTPLMSHPSAVALAALSAFSFDLIRSTSLTLPQTQPRFLSFLLSLSNSSFPRVSTGASNQLSVLLSTTSRFQKSLMGTLMRNIRDHLTALPRLLTSQADDKVSHVAGLIEAICRLSERPGPSQPGVPSISVELGKLLGPTGGIEKWGWRLLSVLEFMEPSFNISNGPGAQLMLEADPDNLQLMFPRIQLRNVSSSETQETLESMFRALGHATGEACLYSVEWFTSVGRQSSRSSSVAAMWCACRIFEGVAGASILTGTTPDSVVWKRSRRLTKLARALAKSVAEIWDETGQDQEIEMTPPESGPSIEDDSLLPIERIQGVLPVSKTLRILRQSEESTPSSRSQPTLQKVFSLHLLAISAGILEASFTSLLIHTLYPVLHSLVSPTAHLSTTALATLKYIAMATSYASPANLLLSNFDYALDAVSRRLTRRWLDVDATKVLITLVRLVGSDVVDRAGDVVEECFDRLDEYHGYDVVVEGLVGVLAEVVKVIEADAEASKSEEVPMDTEPTNADEDLLEWVKYRKLRVPDEEVDNTDYGPAPRKAWGEDKGEGAEAKPEATGDDDQPMQETDPNADPPLTPVQALASQIMHRSIFFLTHGSPVIRAHILNLLGSSVSVIPEGALPAVHSAWPFILNRLNDPEPFVVSAAASLVERLSDRFGEFMFRRIWDDVWPRFRVMLGKLDAADATNALARRGVNAVGTESAYTHSHRLYRSVLKTMIAATRKVHPHEGSLWLVIVSFRRFLHSEAHEELQHYARELYISIGRENADSVWLALTSSVGNGYPEMKFLREHGWTMDTNVESIIKAIDV